METEFVVPRDGTMIAESEFSHRDCDEKNSNLDAILETRATFSEANNDQVMPN